jgi:hypothetical protein
MHGPRPSTSKPAEPQRRPAPAPVLTAVKLMYVGARLAGLGRDVATRPRGGVAALAPSLQRVLQAGAPRDLWAVIWHSVHPVRGWD